MTDTVSILAEAFKDHQLGAAAPGTSLFEFMAKRLAAASPQEAVPTKREAALADLAKLDGETMDLAASPQGEGSSASPIPTAREVRLVLAARSVAFGGHFSPNAIKELDAASEAYAADVPWDEEPAGDCVCVQHGDGPEGCGLCNETGVATPPAMSADHIGDATNMVAPVEAAAYAWASEWTGMGGLVRALHTTEQEAADNAEWMNGRVQPLFTHPAPIMPSADTGELREMVAHIIGEAVNRLAPGQIVFSTLEDADAILDLIQLERDK